MRKSSLLKTHQRYMEMCQMDDQLTPEALRSSDMHWQQETLHTHNRNTLTHTLTHSDNADCTTLATSVSARSCKLFQMACRNALLRGASIRYAAKLSACKSQSKPIYNASQSNHLIILHAHMLRQLTHSTDHVSQ